MHYIEYVNYFTILMLFFYGTIDQTLPPEYGGAGALAVWASTAGLAQWN